MPPLLFGGIRYFQTRHAIYCKLCKHTVESKDNYDFKMCPCGSVGVDGGIGASNRILGSLENIEQRSVYCAHVNGKKFWLPEEVSRTAHLNMVAKYKQNDKVQGGETQGNHHLAEETS